MIAIQDPDICPPEQSACIMDDALMLFYEDLKRSFPGIYVNAVNGKRINNYCGYRPANCPIGSKLSAHKLGKALDLHLPSGLQELRNYISGAGFANGIYRMENPKNTPTWCHIDTIRKDGWDYSQGIYVFNP